MTVHYQDDMITLLLGNASDVVRELEPGSVQTVVTSPPYFGLRDYGVQGQLGAEESVTGYVDRLREVFEGIWQVLAGDGTVWLNLGDSYSGGGAGSGGKHASIGQEIGMNSRNSVDHYRRLGVGPKQLLGVPWEVARALRGDGWFVRSEIIWAKPNPMPESVTDRPTRSHETLFLLSKSPRYYYDAAAIREPDVGADNRRTVLSGQPALEPSGGLMPPHRGLRTAAGRNGLGANKRDVWTVSTVPFGEAHFATYPPDLIRPCILAGSRPGDVVLDPFSGSGTTGQVALQHGRRYVGVDLNPEYLDLSLRTRFAQPPLHLTGEDGAA